MPHSADSFGHGSPNSRIRREKEYPLPHNIKLKWTFSLEPTVVNNATNFPIIIQDEAKLPASVFTNPEHSSFAETSNPNCSPMSEVNSIFMSLRFTLTKGFLTTDASHALRFAFMPIHLAFKEDYIAIDELTSVETQDVLEMTTESTDRQGYGLYNNIKVAEPFSNSSLLGADVPGLDTSQKLESIAFDPELFYDALNYYTIAGKLKTIQDGLRWITLTKQNPSRNILIKQKRDTKRMNPYTYNGVIIYVPGVDTLDQIVMGGADTTADLPHIVVNASMRYLEWNNKFHNERA